MNCWHCQTELIWGGDHDSDDDVYCMESNFTCPTCNSAVVVYFPRETEQNETQ